MAVEAGLSVYVVGGQGVRLFVVVVSCGVLPGGDNLVKGVQCYELFGGIALKNHTFSFFFHFFLRCFSIGRIFVSSCM